MPCTGRGRNKKLKNDGGNVTLEENNQPSIKKTYTDFFNELCPYYMFIGMTYEQYWYGEAELVDFYNKSHKLMIQEKNQELWLQGFYVLNAFETVMSNAFGKKGKKKIEYPKEPYDMFPKTARELEIEAEKERAKAIESFMRLQKAMQQKFDGDK